MTNTFFKEGISKYSLVLLGLFIALGWMIAASFIAGGLKHFKGNSAGVEVKGFAQARIVSDFSTWSGSFSVRDPSMTIAYEKLEKDKETVLAYLEKLGLARAQIKFSPATIGAEYKRDGHGNVTNEVEYYSVQINFSANSQDTTLIDSVSNQSTDLIRQGVKFTSNAPSFFYTKLEETKLALLEAAAKDAKNRAEKITQQAGGKLGALKAGRQGVFQVTSEHSQEVSDYGIMDTGSVVKSVRAVVTLTYTLKA